MSLIISSIFNILRLCAEDRNVKFVKIINFQIGITKGSEGLHDIPYQPIQLPALRVYAVATKIPTLTLKPLHYIFCWGS